MNKYLGDAESTAAFLKANSSKNDEFQIGTSAYNLLYTYDDFLNHNLVLEIGIPAIIAYFLFFHKKKKRK